jgi:hypothetical protein
LSSGDDRNDQAGYALIDMLVGLTVLGLGLCLALQAGGQALRAARTAAALDQSRRALEWRLNAEWRNALRAGGPRQGVDWSVAATPVAVTDPAGELVVCQVEAVVRTPQGVRSIRTHRFCQPGAR